MNLRSLERLVLWLLVIAVVFIYMQIGWVIVGKLPESKRISYKSNIV